MKKYLLLHAILLLFNSAYSQEKTIVEEDFSSNHYNWYEKKADNFDCYIKKGKYILRSKDNKVYWSSIKTEIDGNNENFSFEAAFNLIEGPDNYGYALVFGMNNDGKDYKRFYVANSGHFLIDHYYDNSTKEITKWIKCDKVKKGTNKLKVVRNYNCLSFFINDELVYNHCQITWFGSKFGFQVSGNQEVEVDDVKITSSPKLAPKVVEDFSSFKKENLGTEINTKYEELCPLIAPDGNSIFFVRYSPSNKGGEKDQDIYFSELDKNGTWTDAKNIGSPINNDAHNFPISISPDNNSLLVANKYKPNGESDGSGISVSYRLEGNKWSVPVNQEIIDFKNKNKYVGYFLCSDNKTLLSGLQDDDSYGEKDICVSFLRSDGKWTKPKNLGQKINTACDDFNPFLAADGKTLYFASYGHQSFGSSDIFMSKRLDDSWTNWSEPLNLGPSINSGNWEGSFCISAKADYAYIVSQHEAIGMSDIYRIKLTENQKPQPVILISGKVLDSKSKLPLEASISYFDIITKKEVGTAKSLSTDGSYKIALPAGRKYGFKATKKDYYSISENLTLDTLNDYLEIKRDLFLSPLEVGLSIRLNNVFFDNNKSTLKEESFAELEQLLIFMNENSNISIQISGHTDNVGADEYNLKLSQQRTESVVKYLVDKGITSKRLLAKGYGESKPISINDTDEGRAQNRRVEFSILSK